jgi:hypothetical protein
MANIEVSQMKATILHDEHGEIIAISKIGNLKEAGSKFVKAGMVPGAGQRVLEIELSGEEGKRTLRELHVEYRVDVVTSKLTKKEL